MTTDDRDAVVSEAAAAIVGPAVHTRATVAESAGVPLERATRLWRAMGFAEPAEGAVLFTEQDVTALRTAAALLDAGIVDEDGLVALARSMAQALSRLALSHADIATSYLRRAGADETLAEHAGELVPNVGSLLGYVWRRHLASAAEGAVLALLGEGDSAAPVLVGFADLVGYTELTRELAIDDLAALVERFESNAALLVGEHGGRVVKTLGDEVMFTVDDVRAGVDLTLALAGAADVLGREVRVGAAYGPVLARLGDVFGPTVNVASRLTGLARPGTVLVDRAAAEALRDAGGYDVTPIGRRAVRGYAHLLPFRVRKVTRP
jgi:adenylate cyclase